MKQKMAEGSNMRRIEEASLAAIQRALEVCQLFPVVLYLHGSQGTAWQRHDSDWDFAILTDAPLHLEQKLAFQQVLASALGTDDVDLADLNRCDTVFSALVVSQGKALYVGDDEQRQRYEMLVLAQYARLNEERALILQDIRKRGTVFSRESLA
ncbi:MAG: nucleotidyltransferase domain-containing protein [Zetaproteobacteria bacterium]|nr:nucleotidyltransferase domain-containing protein [Zetaproteobacteria bacterium]